MAERAHPEDPGFKIRWFGLRRNRYRKKLIERYRFCNQYIKGKTVLDIPCGVGWGTSLLKGAHDIIGVDISADAISYAKEKYQNQYRKFYIGDLQSIDLDDNSIDVVVCLEGFEHVSKDIGAGFLQESKRVLKSGGLMIMTCPVLNALGESTGNPYHVYEYPELELIDIINRSFRILSLERIVGPDGPEYKMVLKNIKNERYKKR